MRIALVNPAWTFDGSIYFGCREPHLPIELGFAAALLAADGHDVEILDGALLGLTRAQLRERVARFRPDMTVLPTAPTYLFWRCPPPELRVPRETLEDLAGVAGATVVVGPHASTSPSTTLAKLGADAAVRGECEEVIRALAGAPRERWGDLPSVALAGADGHARAPGRPHTTDLEALPALRWPDALLEGHRHHHHRFDAEPAGLGAEIEWSRGCPYRCSFCAKETHRDTYRRRPLDKVLAELDALVRQGVAYVYFIDEIFLPDRALLEALRERPVTFGVQTRIDLWSPSMLDRLGAAGCVSIEAGVESASAAGRARLDKRCRLDDDELLARLVHARRAVPFVQATLMESGGDDPAAVSAFRAALAAEGVWANEPVPLFPYPGSPDYRRLWGEPDDQAWERAHEHYLTRYQTYSDIQERSFVRLPILEAEGGST
jgi:B12-binding domain/radical SAM domain protein of rhizo-twelve system